MPYSDWQSVNMKRLHTKLQDYIKKLQHRLQKGVSSLLLLLKEYPSLYLNILRYMMREISLKREREKTVSCNFVTAKVTE